MILFKMFGVLWLSICSVFSYGSRESCVSEAPQQLEAEEYSSKEKRAVASSQLIYMPLQELFKDYRKIYELNNFYRVNGLITLNDMIPSYPLNYVSEGNRHIHSHVELIGSSMNNVNQAAWFVPDYYEVIRNPYYYPSNDSVIRSIDFDLYSCPSGVNCYNTVELTFTTRDYTEYVFKCYIYFNPLVETPGGDTTYNPNITDIYADVDYYMYYYNDDDVYSIQSLCFKQDSNNPFYYAFTYQSGDLVEAYQNGFEVGYESANQDYYDIGYDVGFTAGQQTRNESDYNAGYNAGITDAGGTNPYLNSIANGIFQVGLLPVNVFLSIFNFELFGINISGLVSGLLTMTVVIIIIRFLFGGKND